jgi:catechol 2,3-dioxygenase-like lactoylglutathione lyase family enzyme
MLTGIDHVIIGVHDLEGAARRFEEQLGLRASGGGIHPSGGTANRIIVIGETYLELIAVRAPDEAQPSLTQRLAKGEGYLNVVIGSNDLQADSATMRERGVTVHGPTAGQLRSADGRARGWLRGDVERPDLAQHYPFLIQHDSAGEERRFRLAGWAQPPAHPLGATRVLSVTIAVRDLREATQRFHHIYGLQPSESFTGEADGWDALLVAFPLGSGPGGQSLELASPLALAAEDDAAIEMEHLPDAGALRDHLALYGESVCRMTLAVEDIDTARRYLDEHAVTYTFQQNSHPVIWIHPDYACGASIVLHEDVRE